MADTYTLIEKITVGAAGASSVTFTSIPQTYTDLKVVVSGRTDRATVADGVYISINSSTSTFSNKYLEGDGATANSGSSARFAGAANGNTSTASTFSNFEIYFPNYTGSTNKSFSIDSVIENNATTGFVDLAAGLWSTTSAITSITLTPDTGNFAQYSTFYLYGIAKEGVNPSLSSAPYATGGDSILFDGTYWIHTFTSSGTFTPKKSLTCDYLVVAGGGGGGVATFSGNAVSGGGGAGGYRTTVGTSGGGGSAESALSLLANTGYTVTIGAGGNGSPAQDSNGTNGSNSTFSTITSTGGGYGTSRQSTGDVTNPSSGGSGGGGGGNLNGASGTANQGYAGGNSTSSSNSGAGGGGAGGAGGNAGANVAGAAGAGLSSSISGSAVTRATGGRGRQSNAVDGTANTGNGGDGGNTGGTPARGGNGGSGIVIVRYAA